MCQYEKRIPTTPIYSCIKPIGLSICSSYLLRFWVDRVLDVALANNPQVPDNLDGGAPQHVVLIIIQRLTRSHNYRLAGVNSQRVYVFHVTNLEI